MPGEESLLQEFLDEHLSGDPERQLLGQLERSVFEAMKLAGEAGSLLKIEEEMPRRWRRRRRRGGLVRRRSNGCFRRRSEAGPAGVGPGRFGDDRRGFWAEAEDKIYAALRAYAETAENGGGYQRRLFADDAARGFAFIDSAANAMTWC